MKYFLCLFGFHRWFCNDLFQANNMVYGLECGRCTVRRLSLCGARPNPPPTAGSVEDAESRAIENMARRWAAYGQPVASEIRIWWC